MVSNKHTRLTPAELAFWKAAYLASRADGTNAPEGVAHKKADEANAAVRELRRVIKEGVA